MIIKVYKGFTLGMKFMRILDGYQSVTSFFVDRIAPSELRTTIALSNTVSIHSLQLDEGPGRVPRLHIIILLAGYSNGDSSYLQGVNLCRVHNP